ncbi:hypothetical protein [Pseudomonas sp. Teo4]|nr:hypothetical protein [Pseudomonas sp. Teo4]
MLVHVASDFSVDALCSRFTVAGRFGSGNRQVQAPVAVFLICIKRG